MRHYHSDKMLPKLRQLADWGLMITIVGMCMIVHPAKTVVEKMRRHNEGNGWNENPGLVMNKE